MLQILKPHNLGELGARLRDACEVNASLMTEVLNIACRRYPSLGQSEKTARLVFKSVKFTN